MTDTMKAPPIVPQEYLGGVNVVDIGDIRVARGKSRRPHSMCKHKPLVYDQQERRIWCKDCEQDIEPFDAFKALVENFDAASKSLKRRAEAVAASEQHNIIRVAAKRMDEHFRRKNMVPACPHCGTGIFPEDVPKMSSVNRRWEEAMRAKAERSSKP